jgi:hypothetical protein
MQVPQVSPTPLPVDPNFHTLALVMGWTLTVLIAAFAVVIIFKILKTGEDRIDLRYLIAGTDGDASLSRFQFLIFTFVIALSLFLIIVSVNPPAFPPIPGGILALLGISGGSYVVSKGVDANLPPTTTETKITPAPPSRDPTVEIKKTEPPSTD